MKIIKLILVLVIFAFQTKAQALFDFQTFSVSQYDSLGWKYRCFYSLRSKKIEDFSWKTIHWIIDTNSIFMVRENNQIQFKLNEKVHNLKFKYQYSDMKHLIRFIKGYKIELYSDMHCKGGEWAGWNRLCISNNGKKICRDIFQDWK